MRISTGTYEDKYGDLWQGILGFCVLQKPAMPVALPVDIKKVGVTRLERATTWSQTRCATNCATPRCSYRYIAKSGAKIQQKVKSEK